MLLQQPVATNGGATRVYGAVHFPTILTKWYHRLVQKCHIKFIVRVILLGERLDSVSLGLSSLLSTFEISMKCIVRFRIA